MSEEVETMAKMDAAQDALKLDEVAVKIAVKLIKQREGCELRAYPDPKSPLSKALSLHNLLRKYKAGEIEIPEEYQKLSGTPWTIGYGNTEGVKQGDVWSLERAESDLNTKVRGRMLDVLKAAPKLSNQSPERIAACTSLAYNIGVKAFKDSTVAKMIAAGDHQAAANAFGLFDKVRDEHGNLVIDAGLVNRRKIEADLYRAV